MDGAWVARARWRRRGAWLWPAFAAFTIADAVIGHELPPAGDAETIVGYRQICAFDAKSLAKKSCGQVGGMPDGTFYVKPTGEVWATTPRTKSITIIDATVDVVCGAD